MGSALNVISREQQFIVSAVRVGRSWRRIADAAAAEFGLTDATALPLLYLSHSNEAPRQAALAEMMGIERPSLAWLLDQLESMKFVERREDPTDRRGKTVHLTAKGKAATRKIQAVLQIERKKFLSCVNSDDLQAGLRALNAVLDANINEAGSEELELT